jgi:copper(I)-binding protein
MATSWRAVVPVGCLAFVAGCGSHTVPGGTSAVETRVGTITISDAHVIRPATTTTYPAGATASVDFLLQNSAAQRDALVAVSSPTAQQTELLLDGRVVPQVLVPADNTVTRGTQARLRGLTAPVGPSDAVPVTFRFQRAGEVTLRLRIR